MYKTKTGTEIDIECATVYVNRPDLIIKMLESVPDSIPLHFVQETSITQCPSLKEEIMKRPNVSFYEKEQGGCATDWNYCTRLCKSKYLMLLSSDVYFLENLFDDSIDVAMQHRDIKLWSYKKKNMKAWLYDVDFFWENGGFDEQFWIGGEDEDFMWRMMKKGYNFGQFRTHKLDHLEGGKHTRGIPRPINPIKSATILVTKWGWTTKDQMNAEIKPLEAEFTKSFWC